jgi:galactose-1-phosphate uridylyltransferase
MSNLEKNCDFCDIPALMRQKRIVRTTDMVMTIVSNPRFTDLHCLIIPLRHVHDLSELSKSEHLDFMQEEGFIKRAILQEQKRRLKHTQCEGAGIIALDKTEPTDPQNGITVFGHFHKHIYPFVRPDHADRVPAPRSDSDFYHPPDSELQTDKYAIREQLISATFMTPRYRPDS